MSDLRSISDSVGNALALAEDRRLLDNWLAGPGARPTSAERQRWAQAVRDGRLPLIHRDRRDDDE